MATLTRRQLVQGITVGAAATPIRSASLPKPRLFILLIAEQFRADYLDRYAPYLERGGFSRLTEEGAYFPVCRHSASTFSSTAVATILTGAWPEVHGTIADQWFDASERRTVSGGSMPPRGTTLLEEVGIDPANRAWGTGLDRRFEALTGASFFASLEGEGSAPKWLSDERAAAAASRHLNAPWQGLRAPAGSPPLRVLADDPANPENFRALYRSSPFALHSQFDLLRAMIPEAQPGPGGVALLTAVLSPPAQLGYETGAWSPLMRDLVLHTDHQIALTLDAVSKSWAAGNCSIVFVGAHGSATAPPEARRKELTVAGDAIAQNVDHALSAAFDAPPARNRWVDRYIYPNLWLRREVIRKSNAPYAEVLRIAGEAALRVPGVAAWFSALGVSSRGGDWLSRFRRSFHTQRSGDLMFAYESGVVEETGAGRGISYGSLYNYDADVPLILHGPSFNARTFDEIAESVDVAPTLARVMRVAIPSAATGRILSGALVDR